MHRTPPATVAVTGILRYPAERIDELLPHLRNLIRATRANDGCIAYNVARDLDDPGLLRFSELWPDHETLTSHFKAAHMEPWLVASRACGVLERQFTAYDLAGSRAL